MTKKQRFQHESTIRDHIHAVYKDLIEIYHTESLNARTSAKLKGILTLLGYTQDEVQALLKDDYEVI
jgi:hypothetical protein